MPVEEAMAQAFDELHVFLADTVPHDVDHEIMRLVGRAPDATIVAPGSLSPVPGRVLIFGNLSEAHRLADAILNRFKRALGATNIRVFSGYSGGRWGAYPRKRRAKYLGGRPVYMPAQRFTKNPFTPPGAFWPRYELKIVPGESYIHQGKRIIIKWNIVMWTFDPDAPRPIESVVGEARDIGGAEKAAFDYARRLHDKELRNPNDIRVFDYPKGQCIWSSQGRC